MIIIGMAFYSLSIRFLEERYSIDFFKVFDISDHRKYLRFLLCKLVLIDLSLFLFYNFISSDYKFLSFIVPLVAFFLPIKHYSAERKNLVQTLFRLVVPKSADPTPQIQIVFADILTSYAKVLADWDLLFFCSLLNRFNSSSSLCVIPGLFSVMLVCFPYFCRVRQCLHDLKFQDTPTDQLLVLVNILKYASSFPVIYLSYLLIWNRQGWNVSWILVNLVNYILSTSWDVLVDWKLFHRRPPTLFKLPKLLVYSIVLCNAIIRGVWCIRIINQRVSDSCFTIICIAEIARRFLWLLMRCDSLFCQNSYQPLHLSVPISNK